MIVNAHPGFKADSGRWGLRLWVKNLFDVNAAEVNFHWGAGLGPLLDNITARYQQPRTYGVTLDLHL